MSVLNLVSLLGCLVFCLLAWLAGGCRRPVSWRTILGSGVLMLAMGVVVFLLPPTRLLLLKLNDLVVAVLIRGNAGAEYLFGPLALSPGNETAAGEPSIGFVLAAQVLPAVIFFAALMAALYHLGVVQPVVRLFARLFHRTLKLSGAESLAGSSNIFLGVESAATVRPYLEGMTRSELLTVLTCGMSTVASTTLALYVFFLNDVFPQIAGHLISASVLSVPAAAMISKLILPESAEPETAGRLPELDRAQGHGNAMSTTMISSTWKAVPPGSTSSVSANGAQRTAVPAGGRRSAGRVTPRSRPRRAARRAGVRGARRRSSWWPG